MVGFGLQVMAIGLIVVFVALVLLIAIITVQSYILSFTGKKKVPAKQVEAPAPAPVIAPPVQAAMSDDSQIAAAIAAVLMVLDEGGASSNGLRVKSVRRVGVSTPAWNAAGRKEMMGTRF